MKKEKDEQGYLTKRCQYVKDNISVGSIACQDCINNLTKVKTNLEWVATTHFKCAKEEVND